MVAHSDDGGTAAVSALLARAVRYFLGCVWLIVGLTTLYHAEGQRAKRRPSSATTATLFFLRTAIAAFTHLSTPSQQHKVD